MTKIFVIEDEGQWPPSAELVATIGADEFVFGYPPRLVELGIATPGLHDVTPPPPPPLTSEEKRALILAERTRRLELGFNFDFGDERGVHRIGTTAEDMRGWDEVSKGAAALVALGQGAAEFTIVTETGPAVITALEWQQVLVAATMFRQPIWAASFVLQATLPDDFADDAHWPQ